MLKDLARKSDINLKQIIVFKFPMKNLLTISLLLLSASLSVSAQLRPDELQSEYRPLFRPDTLSICFIGDVMLHQAQIDRARLSEGNWDFSPWFEYLEDRLRAADVAIANMEFTLPGAPYSGYPCFGAPDQYAQWVADCGVDIFLAANNHIFDKGTAGAVRTLEKYREMEAARGIRFTGLSGDGNEYSRTNPLIFTVNGFRIALVNFTYGTNASLKKDWPKVNRMSDKDEIRAAVERAERLGADLIIALPHWGEEFKLKHSKDQEKMADFLVGAGVDAIIGTHPHVVQDTTSISRSILHRGRVPRAPVVYSLGNSVSNMSAPNTQLELLVNLRIARDYGGFIKILPVELVWLWCSRPGGFRDNYTVIPVKDFIGKSKLWSGKFDYDNMVDTFKRVSGAQSGEK